jgi:CRISPR-associated protein Cmr5
MSRTLEQERAAFAMGKVLPPPVTEEKEQGNYATLIRKLPAMVIHNGLGQSLAYLLADAERHETKPSWKLYKCIEEWVCGRMNIYDPQKDLMKSLMEGKRKEYLHAQQEALSLLAWMTKFADAYLPNGGR